MSSFMHKFQLKHTQLGERSKEAFTTGEDNRARQTDNPAGQHPVWTICAPTSINPTIFMLDAIPIALQPSQFILV